MSSESALLGCAVCELLAAAAVITAVDSMVSIETNWRAVLQAVQQRFEHRLVLLIYHRHPCTDWCASDAHRPQHSNAQRPLSFAR